LSDVDWTRILLLTETSWASDLLGAGVESGLVTGIPDAEAVTLLRSIQRKLTNTDAEMLFPGAGRPRPPFDHDAWAAKDQRTSRQEPPLLEP
jgi:hypothetical protein